MTTVEKIWRNRLRATPCMLVLLTSVFLGMTGRSLEGAKAGADWSDRRLDVTQGLVFLLDASRQNEARKTLGLPILDSENTVGVAFDGSAKGAKVLQRRAHSQPKFIAAGEHAVFRFDGVDDFLETPTWGFETKEITIYLVAAPRANPGGFSALLSLNATAKNDYTTGLNIDQGALATSQLETINIEGAGFSGMVDLMTSSFPFESNHVLEIVAKTGVGGVELAIDGQPQHKRDRGNQPIVGDELTLGARFCSTGSGAPFIQGHFAGDIAEVLIYNRALDLAERAKVNNYLNNKYRNLAAAIVPTMARLSGPMQRVAKPPEVQMLVPGFSVRRIPIVLKNINNIKYRSDGKLVALGYNGDIHLLSDRDGDGLEDHVDLFWNNQGRIRAPIGMALTPPGYPLGEGIFIASKSKCSLILDADRDGTAEKEIVIAQGWKELSVGVDALGVAMAKDGSIYFGLGTEDYTNAHLVDRNGKAHYDVSGERGTIQRVSPDFKTRETIATGIRIPVSLAFNPNGDLFATDQEGATWLPNGNPFDELLHIQSKRHYGFPPRHSRHLPGVIDEPSVFDFAPQHQSACGLTFNEPVNGGPTFGPAWWRGDAIVCGYSRGKLFRTKLFKTSAGYLARTDLLACLDRLTIDACVSPSGDLVVATHSGGPDWGSGPNGEGQLDKIHYDDKTHPQPVAAWFETASEIRIAFDRPIPTEQLAGIGKGTYLIEGRYVSAGDRFESFRPGYAVVAAQMVEPVHELPVMSVGVLADQRTLVIATPPCSRNSRFALRLPAMGRPKQPTSAARGTLPQDSSIDIGLDLNGVHASWLSEDGKDAWEGWLPHLDLEASRIFTKGSASHDRLWSLLEKPGKLKLLAQLNLVDMLRPAVQPGAKVDDTLPPERVTLDFECPQSIEVKAKSQTSASPPGENSPARASFTLEPARGALEPIEIVLNQKKGAVPRLSVSFHTNEDSRARALSASRILLPWATLKAEPTGNVVRVLPEELQGGNWLRGREVFSSEQALCSKCHKVRGQGGSIGPDLTNLVERDHASVTRDIREPSYAINPDYIAYNIALADGRVLNGSVRTEGESIRVGDPKGTETVIARSSIEEMKPQAKSVMPEGLEKAIGPENFKHLLTFLLSDGLEPARLERAGAPPPRTRSELEKVLQALPKSDPKKYRPLRIVLSSGPKDHGVDEHDYPRWRERWATLLGMAEGVTVSKIEGWPTKADFEQADAIVMFSSNPGWDATHARELDAFLERGGGFSLIHYAVNGRGAPEAYAQRVGLSSRDKGTKYRHGKLDLVFSKTKDQPITAGFDTLELVDESYWEMTGDPARVNVLATSSEDQAPQPMLWLREQGKGRVFCSIAGHYTWTFDDPLYRVLLLRGIAWSVGEPVDRFNELASVGARMTDGDVAKPKP